MSELPTHQSKKLYQKMALSFWLGWGTAAFTLAAVQKWTGKSAITDGWWSQQTWMPSTPWLPTIIAMALMICHIIYSQKSANRAK